MLSKLLPTFPSVDSFLNPRGTGVQFWIINRTNFYRFRIHQRLIATVYFVTVMMKKSCLFQKLTCSDINRYKRSHSRNKSRSAHTILEHTIKSDIFLSHIWFTYAVIGVGSILAWMTFYASDDVDLCRGSKLDPQCIILED